MLACRAFFFCLRRHRTSVPSSRVVSVAAMSKDISINPTVYPLARRDDSIVDDFNGVKVADPYRWMEDPNAKETEAWVDELNKISKPFFAEADIRDKLRKRYTDLMNFEKYGLTAKHGDYYYYWHNTGLQNQYVMYQQKDFRQEGVKFFDPNELSPDGLTSVRLTKWTEDGSIFAYGLSEKGSDWTTLKFKKVNGEDLPDTVTGVKHSNIAWLGDFSGVFYSSYPEHKGEIAGSCAEKDSFHSLYFHKLGTPQSEDVLVADFRHDPNLMHSGSVSRDGRFLLVDVSKGCDPKNQVYYFDLTTVNNKITGKLPLKPFFDSFDAKYGIVNIEGDSALVLTNKDSPMFKLIRVKIDADNNNPDNWTTLIPEDPKRKLDFISIAAGDKMLVGYMQDCSSRVYVNDFNTGNVLCEVPLEIGTISAVSCHKKRTEVFFMFESYLHPAVVRRFDFANVDLATGKLNIEDIRSVKVKGFDPSKYTSVQHFATSKDGTKIPMFLIHPKELNLNGDYPTILNGYGGFNVADEPHFSVSQVMWILSFGGVVACSNLRGGSEYGEKWHEGGMLSNKQNVFDDFIACAEYLIENKYTSSKRLAIHGGSNGGLLVGAVSQQRPDLFGAAINRVGVLDMLRFHKFTVGSAWLPEYGNPDKAEDFKYIYKYSPLHNISVPTKGQIPSTMLMTADHDDRVVPSHSLKYMAQLYHTVRNQAADTQTNPLVCRVEVKAGHGAGKPTSKVIDEIVDMYSFLYRVLGTKYHD